MQVSKTFQGISGKHAKAAAVVGYFSWAVEILINETVEQRVGGVGWAQAFQCITNRVKNIGISPDLHGYIHETVAFRICEVAPDSIKNRLANAEESSKPVGTNHVVNEESWFSHIKAHKRITLVPVKMKKFFRKFGNNDFRERPGLLQGNSIFGKK